MDALYSNTTGNFNTAAGLNALYSNLTGTYNTAQGFNALFSSRADGNSAVGVQALSNTTSGYGAALGYRAGFTATTGTGNLFLGALSNTSVATVKNATVVARAAPGYCCAARDG
jgi:hypothetical protein